jgi:hypothetical protein
MSMLLAVAATAAFTERLIQAAADEKSKLAIVGAVACKVLQMGVAAQLYFPNRLDQAVVTSFHVLALYTAHKHYQDQSNREFYISLAIYNIYRVYLSVLCGSALQRHISGTQNMGPVRVITSLALFTIMAKNVMYDVKHLGKQIRSFSLFKGDWESEEPIFKVIGSVVGLYIAYNINQYYHCK